MIGLMTDAVQSVALVVLACVLALVLIRVARFVGDCVNYLFSPAYGHRATFLDRWTGYKDKRK